MASKTKGQNRQARPSRGRDAALACGVSAGDCKVREITMAIGALLEEIESPLSTGRKPESSREMLPTFFIMTRPAAESQELLAQGRERFDKAVMEWADTLPVTAYAEIGAGVRHVNERLMRITGSGESNEGNAPSAVTAGSSSC